MEGLHYRLLTDDIPGHKHGRPADASAIISPLEDCATVVSAWCAAKRLQLNAKKIEVLLFGTPANLHKIPSDNRSIRLGSTVVHVMNVVRDLGVFLDAELSMCDHVARTAQTCFYHLRRLRAVRRQLGRDVTARLVSAFVFSRPDFYNVVVTGLPASTFAPLRRVLHAAARLVLDLSPRDHMTQALQELHLHLHLQY